VQLSVTYEALSKNLQKIKETKKYFMEKLWTISPTLWSDPDFLHKKKFTFTKKKKLHKKFREKPRKLEKSLQNTNQAYFVNMKAIFICIKIVGMLSRRVSFQTMRDVPTKRSNITLVPITMQSVQ